MQPRQIQWWQALPATDAAQAKPDNAVTFWALVAFTVMLLIAPQTRFPLLAPLRLALVAALLAVATFVVDRLVHRQPLWHGTREMRITLCLLGWSVVTAPFSFWPGGSVMFLLDTYLKTLVVFWLLSHVIDTLPRLRQILWGLSLMAAPLAVDGVENFLSGNFVADTAVLGVQRIVGYDAPLTKNPNDLAMMLNLILPLSVALLLATRRPAVRVLLFVLIGLDMIAIIATFSRAGFLTLAVTLGMYLWALHKRQQRGLGIVLLVLALMLVPFFPASYVERLGTITDIQTDRTGSAQERWSDTAAAVKYVTRNPLIGAGVGVNMLAMNQARGETWRAVHNVYLQYAVELGVPGLVLFLMLLHGCFSSARAAQQRSAGPPPSELFYLAEGIRIGLVAFAVSAMFHPAGYNFYFYYIAGLAIAAKAIADSTPSAAAA